MPTSKDIAPIRKEIFGMALSFCKMIYAARAVAADRRATAIGVGRLARVAIGG
jgi:hypothetical protein